MKDGKPLALSILTVNEGDGLQIARLVREQLRRVGIDASIEAVSFDRLIEELTREDHGRPAPTFDLAVSTWSGGLDPSTLLELATTNLIGVVSDTFYSNPVYDRLNQAQIASVGVGRRKALIQRQVQLLQRDLPYIALTYTPSHQAFRTDRVAGLTRSYPRPYGTALTIAGDQVVFARPAGGQRTGATNGLLVTFLAAGGLVALSRARRTLLRRRRGPEAIEL
jgi:peptide/nickel transport system substrate-binding protein